MSAAPLERIVFMGVSPSGHYVEKLRCGHSLVYEREPASAADVRSRRCEQCYSAGACPLCEGGQGPMCSGHF